MPLRRHKSASSGSSGTVETRNILNGVLNCAWDKTSAVPKLLEVYNDSQVKFNISSDDPLVLAFANGWDDKDRPAQVIKKLTTAPANINLSDKANRHVQIVARVINDELVITTHDIYDPGWETWTNIIPTFTSNSPTGGWSISADRAAESGYEVYKAVDKNPGTYYKTLDRVGSATIYLTAPFPIVLAKWGIDNSNQRYYVMFIKNIDTGVWQQVDEYNAPGGNWSRPISSLQYATDFSIRQDVTWTNVTFAEITLYEAPTAKFYRSLNKVKDRAGVEQLWINLGYATVDANGAITALHHYTDLRNNYPGGMRVEA